MVDDYEVRRTSKDADGDIGRKLSKLFRGGASCPGYLASAFFLGTMSGLGWAVGGATFVLRRDAGASTALQTLWLLGRNGAVRVR